MVDEVPDDIRELLTHTARGYLPYLNANVDAILYDAAIHGLTPLLMALPIKAQGHHNIAFGVSTNYGSIIDGELM